VAGLAAIPVIGRSEAVNVVTTHPMSVRSLSLSQSLLAEADLVLVVDCDVPWIPRDTTLAAGCFVAQIDRDPVKADMPLWSFPIDLSLCADPAVALGQLAGALERHRERAADRWEERRRSLAPAIASANQSPRSAAAQAPQTDVRAAVLALSDALEPGDLVVEEAISNAGPVAELLERPEPGTLYSAGGPGLGWSPGAAVGIKLARPDRRVVAVVGDGAFLFSVPTATLALAAEAKAPVVLVVLNNGGYRASRLPVLELFPDGVSARRGEVIGAPVSRPVDFVALAQACGAHGERTSGAAGLGDAIRRALAAADGVSAVVDVQVEQSD
jgi:acetolactate synthase-1/2/3 large subunit